MDKCIKEKSVDDAKMPWTILETTKLSQACRQLQPNLSTITNAKDGDGPSHHSIRGKASWRVAHTGAKGLIFFAQPSTSQLSSSLQKKKNRLATIREGGEGV